MNKYKNAKFCIVDYSEKAELEAWLEKLATHHNIIDIKYVPYQVEPCVTKYSVMLIYQEEE